MKKWKITLYITGLLWIAVLSQLLVNKLFLDENRIVEAFVKCDTNVYESSLDVVADFGQKVMSVKQSREQLCQLAKDLNIDKNYTLSDEVGQRTSIYTLLKSNDKLKVKLEFITVMPDNQISVKEGRHFLIINISSQDDFEQIMDYKKKVEKKLREKKIKDYQASVTMHGGLKGKLTDVQKEKKAIKLMKVLRAEQINTIKTDNMYTVYAYTGLVKDYIKVSGYRININIAFAYDEEKNETQLYLATPIMNNSY